MQFRFDVVADHGEGFVDLVVELLLTETVGKFDLDGGVVALARVLPFGGDLLRIRCIEFQHFSFSLKNSRGRRRNTSDLSGVDVALALDRHADSFEGALRLNEVALLLLVREGDLLDLAAQER